MYLNFFNLNYNIVVKFILEFEIEQIGFAKIFPKIEN